MLLMNLIRLFQPSRFETEMNSRIAQLEAIIATNSDFSLKNVEYWEFVQRLEIYKEILALYKGNK